MKTFSRRSKRNARVLKVIIEDIDKTITKAHTLRVDFAKGSVNQRLIDDLDGARVTARAILSFQEQPDVDTTA